MTDKSNRPPSRSFPPRPGSGPRPRPDPRPDARRDDRSKPKAEARSDARPRFDPLAREPVDQPQLDREPRARSYERPAGKPGGKPAGKSYEKPWPRQKDRDRAPSERRPADQDRRPAPQADDTEPIIFGNHAAEAALRNPRRPIQRAHLTENAERRFGDLARARKIPIENCTPRDLDRRLGPDTVHQGVLLEVEGLPDYSLEELVANAAGRPILVLDQVTDPHNVGAILRSAAVFGSGGLVMTRRHSPPPWGVLAKSASGALEHVPIAFVTNLAQALATLREEGCTVVGLDGEATALIDDADLTLPTAIVLGAEGKGLRHLTRQLCDKLVAIGTDGPLNSLNVSNAAAIALHLSAFRRRNAKS